MVKGAEKMVRERATEECMSIGEAYDEGYEQGIADERMDWKCAVGTKIIKHADDIYEALPDLVTQIRTETIDECIETINKWIDRQSTYNRVAKYIGELIIDDLEQLKEKV